jgi:predicted O-methyltransferase YrrM
MSVFRRAYHGAVWLVSFTSSFLRFLLNHPGMLLPASKWVLMNLPTLPHLLYYKTHIDEARNLVKKELAECKATYEELQCCPPDTLRWLGENSGLPGVRRWALIYFLVRAEKCHTVVETGVAEGVSTSYILHALAEHGGWLHSIDLPNQFYLTTEGKFHAEFNAGWGEPGYLIPSELRGNWELILGRSSDTLPKVLANLGKIDLFLHDSEKTYNTMTFEYEHAWQYLRAGGYLVSDDATWNTAFDDFVHRKSVPATIIRGMGFIRKPDCF